MKKLISILLLMLFLTGCGNQKIDLNNLKEKLLKIDFNEETIYNDHQEITNLEDYNLTKEDIEEYFILLPKAIKNPHMIMVIKPKNGKTNIIKDEINEMLKKYDNSWGVGEGAIPYFPEAASLIENRLERIYGDYLIYIISPDNELVYKEITK